MGAGSQGGEQRRLPDRHRTELGTGARAHRAVNLIASGLGVVAGAGARHPLLPSILLLMVRRGWNPYKHTYLHLPKVSAQRAPEPDSHTSVVRCGASRVSSRMTQQQQ
jgi:hypothetical protein